MHESVAATGFASLQIGWLDIAIILLYLVGIVGIGCFAGLRRKHHEGDTYFLGGRTITWPIIGTALFASNISTVHMVSFAECGYKSGLLYGNFEWMAPFTLICLSLFFAPFYIRSGVTTLPDFLEKRYNRACRDWLALLSLVAAVVIHIGFAYYTGARVLHGMFQGLGISLYGWILIAAGLAGLYTIVGGLLAVMWTEAVQTVILLTGAICITLIGLREIGGWGGLQESVHPVNLSIIRPSSDPTGLSMWAVFLGYPVIGLWYWCCDQVIVQRVLAAKDENHARLGPLFTGFIKILPMFIFVLPGLICLGLIQKGVHTDPLADPKDTLTYLINHVLPTGVKGIMAAALLAAMMGSVSAALNSIATVFSYDVVKRWRPQTTDKALVLVGRIVTAVAMLAAIAWSPLIDKFDTIFQGLTDLICYMAPPVTAVFLLGVFWRRASGRAALVTLLSGAALGLAVFIVDFFNLGTWTFPYVELTGGSVRFGWTEPGEWAIQSMISGFFMFLLSIATLIVFSYLLPHRHTAESEALVWKSLLDPLRGKSWRLLGNYRLVALLLFATMLALYWGFAGDESYYPIKCQFTLADGQTPVANAKVTLQCSNPRFNFSAITDKDGICAYGTESLAGGAPAGTAYRVQVISSSSASLPKKYAEAATSGLEFTVKPERNLLDFRLDSDQTLMTER
jgi:SSS family solute:Na+ symporter